MKEFFDAIKSNNLEKVNRLITGENNVVMFVNKAKSNGYTPLLIASQNGHVEVAQLLLNHGANVNQAENKGWTPLLVAADNGRTEVAQLLLNHGADVNQAGVDGYTPLSIAAQNGRAEVAQLLLDHGANVNQAMTNGATPLYIAAQRGRVALAQLLLEGGAVVNQADEDGWRPLYTAYRNQHNNLVALMNACSADGKQRKRAFRAVDLSGKKAVIYYYMNMNQHLIAAALFKSLKPKDRIKLIGLIAPGVNKQYRNLRNFSLVCKEFFNAAASNKANIFYARSGLSLFQEKKFNDIGNPNSKLTEDVLYHMSQFFFVASKDKGKQISMIERLWHWHNEARTRLTPGYESEPYSCCIV